MHLIYAIAYKVTDLFKPFIIVPLFLRTYGIQSYGLLSQIILLVTLMYPILDLGVGYGSQRFFSNNNKSSSDLKFILSTELIVAILGSLIFLVLFYYNSWFYKLIFGQNDNFVMVAATLVYLLVFTLTNTYTGLCRAFGEFKKLVVLKVIVDSLEVLILVIWISQTKNFDENYLYILILMRTLLFFGLFLSLKVNLLFRLADVNVQNVKSFFGFSLFIIPTAFVGFINASSDRLFISNYFGLEEVGLYKIIFQYIYYINLFTFPFTFAYFSKLSRMYDLQQLKSFRNIYKNIYLTVSVVTLLSIIMFYIMYQFIYEVFLGVIINESMYQIIIYTLVSVFFLNLISIQSMLLNVLKKIKTLFIILVLCSSVNVLLNFKYMEIYGYHYAAVSTLISTLLLFSLQIYYIYKNRGALYET